MAATKLDFILSSGLGVSADNYFALGTADSSSISQGSLISLGGAGIAKSLSVGGRLQIFNGSNYTAFVSSASGNTVYTLPAFTPATGTSVLQSDIAGVLSWVPMTASGGPGGSGTVTNSGASFLAYYKDAGTAVTANPSLSVSGSGLTVGFSTSSISSSSGALTIAGGVGIGGSLFVNSASNISGIALNSGTVIGNLTGTATTATYSHQAGYAITSGSSSIATTATYSSQAGYAITSGSSSIATTATYSSQAGYAITSGSSSIATTALNINVSPSTSSSFSPILFSSSSSGSGLALSAFTGFAFNPSSNILSVSGLAVTSQAFSSSSSSGALIVTGGVGIGESVSIGGRLQLFNGSNFTSFVSASTANTVYTLPPTSPSTGTSVLQSDSSGTLSWVPMVASSASSGTTSQNIAINQAGTANVFHPILFSPNPSSSGSAISSDSEINFNPNTAILYVPGIAVTSTTSSITPTTGSLIVTGGVGIGGSLNVFSATAISGVTINSGVITGSLSGTASTSRNIFTAPLGSSATDHFILASPSSSGSGVAVSSGLGISYTPSTNTLKLGGLGISYSVFSSTASTLSLFTATSTAINAFSAGTAISLGASTGTLTVNNATLRANQNTASLSSTTGSIVSVGGVGIGGSLYVSGTASNISNLIRNNSVVTSGTWSATAITAFYGGTGNVTYSKGDLLAGFATTLSKLSVGVDNYILKSDSNAATGLSWGLITNTNLVNSFIGLGSTTVGLGSTINFVGNGISITYSSNNINLRSAVAITSSYPSGALQGDLLWHDEEGSLKIYYEDGQNEGQWVDASQRWGTGQYITLPTLGSGTVYQMAYYAASGHTVVGDASFVNDTSIGRVTISHATGATSTSTGAFVVSGGVGVGGTLIANSVKTGTGFIENVYVGGNVSSGSTIYADWNSGSVQTYTLTGHCWLGVPTNMPTGSSLTLVISQDGTGGWGMTSNSSIKYSGGLKTLSSSANSIDVINMFYTGSTYLAALTTGYS